ncbi:MAG: response regulator [Draconibacterium sp.]|nr:response regulator [Draconibacterium sp.]
MIENKLILIVEDDEPSFMFIKIVLGYSGFKNLWVKNGEEAIIACKQNNDINLVLMDINLPAMSGYSATKEIKKFKPELPIIAQTAFAILGDREKAFKAGCDDYISKPINSKMLIEKIKILTEK